MTTMTHLHPNKVPSSPQDDINHLNAAATAGKYPNSLDMHSGYSRFLNISPLIEFPNYLIKVSLSSSGMATNNLSLQTEIGLD